VFFDGIDGIRRVKDMNQDYSRVYLGKDILLHFFQVVSIVIQMVSALFYFVLNNEISDYL
jgi:hypothetical protein